MSTEYSHILSIRTQHDYYTNGRCTDLRFTPTTETEALIKNQRLLVRYLPAGIDVFASKLIPLEEGKTLRWLVEPQTNSFFKITELPPKSSSSFYLFSNGNEDLINPTDFNEFGGLEDENGAVVYSFGLLERSSIAAKIDNKHFAVLDIISTENPQTLKSYTLSFKAKKVYGEYLLLNTAVDISGNWQLTADGQGRAGAMVKLPDTPLVGDRYIMANLIWERLKDKGEAIYFCTNEQYPLQEKPDFPIALQKDGVDIIMDLPAPRIKNHNVQLRNGSKINVHSDGII